MNLETFDNVMFEVYAPQIIEQWTTPMLFDTEAEKAFKAKLKKKLESLPKDELRSFILEATANIAKEERRLRYEALKEEFGDNEPA